MIGREALLLSVRALTRRPAESLLLTLSVALVTGATAAGMTLTGTAAKISNRLLASPHSLEIVVSTRVESSSMKLPARAKVTNSMHPNSVQALTAEDLQQARSVSPAVRFAYIANPEHWILGEHSPPRPQRRSLSGFEVSLEFFPAKDLAPAAGSLFTAVETERAEPVMVLGAELGGTLFKDGTALDRTLVVVDHLGAARRYRIVGVLVRSDTDLDHQAFTPVGVKGNFAPERDTVVVSPRDERSLRFAATDHQSAEAAREQLTRYFDAVYGEGLIHVSDPRAEARVIAHRFRRLVRIVLFLALSLLLVATLYLTNIYSGRALRRRRSAGILKATGATATDVFAVFLAEAAVIAVVGGAAGMTLTAALASVIESAVGVDGWHFGLVVAGLAIAWTIVSACSLLPAFAATRAPAAEAIRYE
ncbi:MAG: ABC transporter permease [Spirochaetaceae bacterium]|nr:ABC transporter permease [Spirochaetaceae bacterium]